MSRSAEERARRRPGNTERKRRSREAHKDDPRTPPSFIAIDGEGMNADGVGSEHRYTLLAASTGDYRENVAEGLSTAECLEFLTLLGRAYPGRTFCGFALNYDVNMMLGGVPHRILERLWRTGYARVRMPGDDWYGLSYVPSKWFGVTRLERTVKHGKATYARLYGMRAWDVWGFFQSRFVTVLQQWLPEDQEAIASVERMKEARGTFAAEETEQIRAYCLQECSLLVRVMEKLAETLWGVGLYPRSWLGAGSIASAMLTKYDVARHVRWDDVPEPAREASLWAYFGGRVELFCQGVIPEEVWDYDVRSAYPSTIAELPSLAEGTWDHVYAPGPRLDEKLVTCRAGMVRVRWDTRAHKDAWVAPFPQHYGGGRVAWEPVGTGWYHVAEYRAARAVFGGCIEPLELWDCLSNPDVNPFAFVPALYAERARYKAAGDARHYPLKVGLNSLYGKLAQGMSQRQERRPRWQNYFLAGMVTAATRARILEGLAHVGRSRAIMAATDGLFVRAPLDGVVVPGVGAGGRDNRHGDGGTRYDVPLSDTLGGWEWSAVATGMVLVQAGIYWEHPERSRAPRVRTRGFGVRSVSYWDAIALFTRPWPIEHKYPETRFIGLGYVVNTGHWADWRRWIPLERTMSRLVMPWRLIDEESMRRTGWAHLRVGVLRDPATRRAYMARGERMANPDNDQLNALVELEQPEGAGA